MNRTLLYGLSAAGFLVAVAVTSLVANTPGTGGSLWPMLLGLLPVLAVIASIALTVWFVVTLNKIARDVAEQTRLARLAVQRLDRLVQAAEETV